ncbi:MAG: helix-turn-helix domain-containing protein [Planctomycetota bacterium]
MPRASSQAVAAPAFQAAFFARAPGAASLVELFRVLPHTYFFAKDRQGRFVAVNHLFLDNHGLAREADAIGKTDRDFHPPLLAEAYMAEDERVMSSGRPLPGQLWMVPHRRGAPRWYVCTKVPIRDAADTVIGVAGAMERVNDPALLARYFAELLPVVRHVEEHYQGNVSMAEMARLAGLSPTHFNRRFRQLLRMTPTGYLRAVRVQRARTLLATTEKSLVEIATLTGFTDQSHFTKRFRQTTGLTPDAYRKRFRGRPPS